MDKKAIVNINFEEEKLDALNVYLKEKQIILEDELEDTIQKMYEKHVPQAVRSFIERDRTTHEISVQKRKKRKMKEESEHE